MSQTWCTANTPVWFFSNVPGLVHCRYTSLVLFKCPRPGTLRIHWFGSFQVSQASPPWVHQLGSFGVFQGFPLPVRGFPSTGRGNPWDIRNEPNRCICSAPGLGHSKQTKPVYLQCTRPGTFKKNQTGVPVVYQAWET